jgi:hypothetical protein
MKRTRGKHFKKGRKSSRGNDVNHGFSPTVIVLPLSYYDVNRK